MKKIDPFLTLGLLLLTFTLSAQNGIRLKNGTIYPGNNISETFIDQLNTSARKQADTSYLLLQFKKNPSQQERLVIRQAGIILLHYIPNNAFTAAITKSLNTSFLRSVGITSASEILPQYKVSSSLSYQPKNNQSLEVNVAFFETVDYEAAITKLTKQRIIITGTEGRSNNFIRVKLPANKLDDLAALSFVQSVEPLPPPPTELNFRGRANSRANVLQSSLPGAYNLTGEGVKIVIGELAGGTPQHTDYVDRQASNDGTASNAHVQHVHGIAGGAGLVNELYTGHAPGATLYATGPFEPQNVNNITASGYVLSSNSWGSGGVCTGTIYSYNQYEIDKLSIDYNYLQHVFAAGNSGLETCVPYPAGFGTIFSEDQSAKSVLTVGNTLSNRTISTGSSKGPTRSGLIKPEIVTTGTQVISTVGISAYGSNNGTSMSAPAVTGGLALLYQRYRQLHNGANPKNSLLKAIVCNTATDLGNVGPDYSYGFGWLNNLRAVKVLDNNTYLFDSVSEQSVKTHTLQVPAGTAQLKVMIYWQDPPAAILAGRAIVHDLDLKLTTPASSTVLPYILDTLPSNVAQPATRGEDHVNNIEQVVIDNPQAGTYTITVRGTEVAQNPMQEYVMVYDMVPDDIQLTFPFGGEGLNPGETITTQWDAAGENQSSFSLQFSADSGNIWQNINVNIIPALRQFNWLVPAISTSKAMIRLTRNSDGKMSESKTFVIAGVPTVTLPATQCPGYISLQWTPVAGATDYEVMMVKNGKMVSIDSTTGTNYLFKNLAYPKVYWVTVRARIDGKPGRRAVAVSRNPNTGNCAGNISDNDLRPIAVVSPVFGRILTADSLKYNQPIRARVRNFDDQPISNFELKYSVNNGEWVTENITATLAAQGEASYFFTKPYNFSQPGIYEIKLVVRTAADDNAANDTLTYVVRNATNPVVDLSSPLVENFDGCPTASYAATEGAWQGAQRFDYLKLSGSGNLNIPEFAVSAIGKKGFAMSASSNGTHYVSATYNLTAYDTTNDEIALEFRYSRPATIGVGNEKVWVRGSDKNTWVQVMNLDPGGNKLVANQLVRGVSITRALKNANQNFSTSTQIRWMQEFSAAQFIIDSVTLYRGKKDIELVSIDSLAAKNCALGGATPVRITVQNWTEKLMSDVQAHYRVNGGATITETIPSITAGTQMNFSFANLVDFSQIGQYQIEAWVDMPGDEFLPNNNKTIFTRNQGSFNNFPYLQNFEGSSIEWYSEGQNNSWQLGTPASTKIIGAASGTKAWKTNLTGNNNNLERSYLYSPCFDISGMERTAISFSIAVNLDSCRIYCDQVRLHFSENGVTWYGIGNMNAGRYKQWQSFTAMVPDTVKQVQFRIFLSSDAINNYDGLAIDDIHIYDSTSAIYDGAANSQLIIQTVSGNEWKTFKQNDKIIAAINANGQDLGETTVQAFFKNGGSNFHGQYHLNRSFAISSENPLTDSVTVRLYFLNTETEAMVLAKNCTSCTKPLHAYRLGISTYNSQQSDEINGDISDNVQGTWSFINNNRVKIIPYLKGYYAEFKVKNFSEIWFSNGGYDNNSNLPVDISGYAVQRTQSGQVEIKWTTASEINIDHFDIEIAAGNEAYANNLFEKLNAVNSKGASNVAQQYQFTDGATKTGVVYYRIKSIDEFGNASYTKALPIVFSNDIKWVVAPNHSSGLYNLIFQANEGESVQMEIFNSHGALVKKEQFNGAGFVSQHQIDLQHGAFSKGIYLVRVRTKDQSMTFRVMKR